jgi:hypothetical protein
MPTKDQINMWKNGGTQTNVDYHFTNINQVSAFSHEALKGVSLQRREMLETEMSGFKNASAPILGSTLTKTAQMMGGDRGGGGFTGSGNTAQMNPEIYTPLMLNQNLSMPRDRAVVNAWIRAHFTFNPYIQNAIDLHRTYPISKINIKCHDKRVQDFFEAMAEEIDLLNICIDIAQEYWLLGEAFPYADFNSNRGTWNRIFLQNPDYCVVKKSVGPEPSILIKPDENLKRIVNSNKPSDRVQRDLLPPHVINAIRKGGEIPMDEFNLSHIARKLDITQTRGTGLTVSVFRQLMLMDLIRESELVQFQDLINPMMVVKVGSTEHKPTPESLDAYRQTFEQATYDRNFRIFTHDGVTIETISKSTGIYDTTAKYAQLVKELYIGMMVPSVVIEGGADVTYANGGVTLDVLKQRYTTFRNILAKWLRRKIFAPISKIQGFYERKGGEGKRLIVPDIEWNHMSLFDTNDYISQLVTLTSGEGANKRASLHVLYRSLGLDYDEEQKNMRSEMIQNAMMKKEQAILETYDMSDLRALTEDSEIKEKKGVDAPTLAVPGMGSGEPPPGGGMPDMSAMSAPTPPAPPAPAPAPPK